jgi:hypothetical protein
LGISGPTAITQVGVGGDPDNSMQQDVALTAVIADLPAHLMMDLRKLSLAVTLANAQRAAGLAQVPVDQLPVLETAPFEEDDA